MKNEKRLRSFYCDDDLWVQSVEYADARGIEIDRLIERSLRQAMDPTGRAAAGSEESTSKYRRTENEQAVYGRREEFSARDPSFARDHTTNRVQKDRMSAVPGSVSSEVRDNLQKNLENDRPRLVLQLEDKTVIIDKDRFVIGRSSKGTDFVIRDENVSRKHTAILYHSGHYYIQDLQSTNGTEFNGKRIELRRIEGGDQYMICDYELHFQLEE